MAELPEMEPNCVVDSSAKNAEDVNCIDVEQCVNKVTRCDSLAKSGSATPEVLRNINECPSEVGDVVEASKYFKIPVIKITLENDTNFSKSVKFVSKYFKLCKKKSDEAVKGAKEDYAFDEDECSEFDEESKSEHILHEENTPFDTIVELSQDIGNCSQISEEEDDDREFRMSQLNTSSDEIIVENFFNMSPRKMPESPHRIIEEEFRNNPWVMLVATIFLTKTSGLAARPFMKRFFAEYPTPYAVLDTDPSSLEVYFETLGMRKRAAMIWKMSYQFVSAKWRRASDLYGIGKYGEDAYRLFCLGHTDVEPSDRYLRLYLDWLMSQTDHEEVWGISDCEGVIFDPVAKYYAISLR